MIRNLNPRKYFLNIFLSMFPHLLKLSLLIIITSFISCDGAKDKGGSSTDKSTYFPMSEGNRWSYSSADSTKGKRYNVSVESVKEKDASVTAALSSFPFFWIKDDKRSLKLSKDGELSLIIDGGDDVLLIPVKDKTKKDYNWKSGEWQCYITQTDTSVSAGGKTYEKCLQINYSLSITYLGEIWYAPGVGIVRWGFNRTNPPNMSFEYYYLKRHEVE